MAFYRLPVVEKRADVFSSSQVVVRCRRTPVRSIMVAPFKIALPR